MYGLSYYTLRNGHETTRQLNWVDGRPSRLLRLGRRLARDGAVDVCLENPYTKRSTRIGRDGSLVTISSEE